MRKTLVTGIGGLVLPLMLAAVGYALSGRRSTVSINRISDFSKSSAYCGFVGAAPATASDFFHGATASVYAFYHTGAGATLLSKSMGSLGVLRILPERGHLIYFGASGVEILKPAPQPSRKLNRSWLVHLAAGSVLIYSPHLCELNSDRRWAAFAVWRTIANLNSVNVVRISTGRTFSVSMHGMVTGLAFVGPNLLATTGIESPQLRTYSLPIASNSYHFSVIRKVAAPGRLAGVLGTVPVFQGRMQNVMFVGKKRITFHDADDFDVTCGTREALITAANGRVLLWHANHAEFIARLTDAHEPYYGACGAYHGGFWLSSVNGHTLLVSNRGKMHQFSPKYPNYEKIRARLARTPSTSAP